MLIVALFEITKTWKQLKYRTTVEWTNCDISIPWNTTQE